MEHIAPKAGPLASFFAVLAEHLLNAWVRHTRKPHLEFMFAGMGRIAKSSGAVTPTHIAFAEEVMQRLQLSGSARETAIQWFRQGRDGDADFHQLAARCNSKPTAALSRMSVQSFVGISGIEPGTGSNRTLHFLASLIGAEAVDVQRQCKIRDEEFRQLAAARHILGIEATSTLEKQKRAYRQLASRYHPDKLTTNAKLQERAYATQRSIEVREAWEFLQRTAQSSPEKSAPAATPL